MRARGSKSFASYARVLREDSSEYDRLISTLTINVTSFFRNPATYDCVATLVLPELWHADSPAPFRVWSAGCSTGEEVYSLSVLIRDHVTRNGSARSLRRVSVLGTDIDRDAIATARRGRYPASSFAGMTPSVRDRCFPLHGDIRTVAPELSRMSHFEQGDMLDASAQPARAMNLIVCRNVVIYFTRTAQEALFSRFHELLLPGGFLVLGKVETLLGKSREMFAPVSSRERIFRRL